MSILFERSTSVGNIPRALIIDLSDNFGGANARVLALMKSLPIDCVGLATIAGSQIAPELIDAGYKVHVVANNKFDPRIPFRIARILVSHKYQLVDTQNPQSKLWGSMAALLSGVALISTLNSWYMNEHPRYSLRWFGYSMIEILTNFSLSRYIVVSKEIQVAMLRFGIPADKIDLVYNAIDLDGRNVIDKRQYWLEKYHLPDDAVLCVAVGRLSWAKGQESLIKAVSMLKSEDKRIYCLIAGEGELLSVLENQIDADRLGDRVVLLGHLSRPDVISLVKACDVFVMPSRTEGTPIALLEAAALRKPILATRVGGIPELVKDGEECLLVNVDAPQEIANGIQYIIQDTEFADMIAENAYQRIIDSFSLSSQTQLTIQSYQAALNN